MATQSPAGGSPKGKVGQLLDAVDDRTGYRALVKYVGEEPVPGGASFAYVFGSALLFTFAIQVVTGITLASVYSPSVTDAWASVNYIQHTMTLGWLVRGLHHFGSSAMIVLCLMHMTQVFMYGAHRGPREANWITGVIMLTLVLGFGLTGYLLPWDQKGYWATQVATSIMGGTPGGEPLQTVLQGGSDYGNATLTRFYAIHVFILPITLVLFIAGHVGLFRKHGVTPSAKKSEKVLRDKTQPFWPYQVLYDLLFAAVVLAVLVTLVVAVGVSVEAPADPASGYEARPEWYFLFLFQLLKYFEGPMTLVGTVVIPGLAVGFLLAVPFLDRTKGRGRPSMKVMVPFFSIFAGAGALTAVALASDASSESFAEGRAAADEEARLANELAAKGGVDGGGRIVLFEGLKLFHDKGCSSCHASEADTPAPLLAGYGGRERVHAFLEDPNSDRFFGKTPLADAMDPIEVDEASHAALTEYMVALSGRTDVSPPVDAALANKGEALFTSEDCVACHNHPDWRPGDEDFDDTAEGPDLVGYQSFEWTRALLRDAHEPELFGDAVAKDDREVMMPDYPDLTNDELTLLVRWLMAGAPEAE